MGDITPKGTCLSPFHFSDGENKSCKCFIIPSWVAGGLSPFNHDETFHVDGYKTVPQKRRKKSCQDDGLPRSMRLQCSNLEHLIVSEVRSCDVCCGYVLWTLPVEQSHFRSTYSNVEAISRTKSIAESLPLFIDRHFTSNAAIPCSFCVEAKKTLNKSYSWCGAIYCSKECQDKGERYLATFKYVDELYLPSPKLFFCRNRILKCVESKKSNASENEVLTREVLGSIVAIKQRLECIFGYSSRTSDLQLHVIGKKECALLIITLITCCCNSIVSELLQHYCDIKNAKYKEIRLESSEEGLVEEMWVLSHSYWSLVQSINQIDNEQSQQEAKFPSYREFVQLYATIKQLSLVRVSSSTHPLISYAAKTLLTDKELNDYERNNVLDLLDTNQFIPEYADDNSDLDSESVIKTWRRATHFSHWMTTKNSETESDVQNRAHSWLNRSYYAFSLAGWRMLKHSCAPTLLMTMQNECNSTNTERLHSSNVMWTALHDLSTEEASISKIDSLDIDINTRSIELKRLMGNDFKCDCVRCLYESTGQSDGFSTRQLKRLGDLAMQQGRFEDASTIYDKIINIDPSNADACHAKAASLLGRASSIDFAKIGHCKGFFIQAQKQWNKASSYEGLAKHPEMSVIILKQCAFGIIQELQFNRITDEAIESNAQESKRKEKQYKFSTYLSDKVFLTNDNTPIISTAECQKVIDAAEDYANQSGWTTSRHYAVPTTDIPLHELVDLSSWFYAVWTERIRPLLRLQFKLNEKRTTNRRDIFIHDVFVVRYDANGGQRNLPPHYDESTHSFILSLNTDYQGGGTFIHALGKVLQPRIVGGMISFRGGEILHSGDPVVSGTRYVIAAFCYVDLIDGHREQNGINEREYQVRDMGQQSRQGFSFGFAL